MLISSAAYFSVCKCGRHGWIITATGECSIAFCSKEMARDALSVAVKKNEIAADEQLIVSSQINDSPLAEEERDAAIGTRIKTEIINTVHEMRMKEAIELSQSEYVN
jgi:hypothetical protein